MDNSTHLLAMYSKDVKSVMLSLKSGRLKPSGWMAEMSLLTADYLLVAQKIVGSGSAEISMKEWYQNIQGLDLVISSSEEYDPDWIYRVRAAGRASIKSISTFRARLQAAVNRMLSGGADSAFIATFARSIDVELTKAWAEGADAIGVAPDEMTDEDVKQLGAIIDSEDNFIAGLVDNIREDQLKEMTPEALASKYSARVDVWSTRYPDTVNRAMLWFGQKTRLIWQIGATENHCRTCKTLNGLVAFGWEYDQAGLHPQQPKNNLLECLGFNCDCSLTPTTKRRSVNALKKLQAIAGGG